MKYIFEVLKDSHNPPQKKKVRRNTVIKANDMASVSHLLCTVVSNDQGENLGRL